ncbi:minor tail protein [Gordonia phage Leonard]|uniref:Minor tail protein n=1 Tax=Gordonia phage Leonard TaxID=2656539 RepID=A0A649VLV6_9CAUD|nr:minor tail protein [Gordonia phage Phinally]YP_010002257.1 minor tail protein [Gordonia phage Leonard]AMS03030.1 minor tail protein [Gordonia phage Phinally]QGJ93400.1 minor tail protein [Gordonia phage Leonard]
MTGPSTITITRHAPRVMAGPRKAPFTAWVVPGRDGQGINYTDSVATYNDLPTDLTGDDRGAGYFVVDDGLLYSWNGATFPAQGDGLPIQGEPGPQGRGVQPGGVSVVGTQLRFLMNDGSTDAVTIPAIQQAIDSAAAASSSATAAGTARDAAQAAASTAGTAATTAVGARDAAQAARTGAEAARDTATTAATAADNSADAAALSEANTDTSETNAANSAGAAATSATQADAAADDADAARVAAVAAQTAAQGSATTAGNSAAAAAGSADDAQDSATAAAASAAEAADVVTSGIPNATDTVKGGIRLTGDLGGTWDNPTVPGLAGKADLDDNGKVLISQIPAQALIERRLVASTAERLALTDVQPGDVAIQSGNPGRGSYILAGDDPSLESSWTMFLLPDSPVQSVNGYVGIVVLGKGDVGLGNADNTADLDKPISNAVAAALDGKVDEVATANVAYGTKTGGVQGTWPVTSAATATTLALRGTGGTVAVGDATAAGHAASKGQLDTGLSGKAAAVHQHSAADINAGTLDVARLPVGTGSTQVAAGNDSRIVNAVPNTRTVSAGTGLSGGGDLTANRTLSVQYGTAAGTAAQGNDARLSDTRTPTDNTVATAKIVDAAVTMPKLGADVGPAIQAMIDTSVLAAQRVTVNAQAGAYTLVATDANKAVEVSSASAVNLTIPTDAAVAFPVGTVIEVDQLGAGKVTIVGASGVTVQAPVTPTTRAQYSAVLLRKRAANLWLVSGDM